MREAFFPAPMSICYRSSVSIMNAPWVARHFHPTSYAEKVQNEGRGGDDSKEGGGGKI